MPHASRPLHEIDSSLSLLSARPGMVNHIEELAVASSKRIEPSTRNQLRLASWYGMKPVLSRILTLPLVNTPMRVAASLILPKNKLVRLPVAGSHAVYGLASGARVSLTNPQADQLAKDIIWGKGAPTSPAEARLLRFVERRSSAIDLFLDLGAYSCLFSLISAKSNPDVRAIAFEVLPQNFLLCWQNIIANDAVRQIEVRLCGVAAKADRIVMPLQTSSASNPSSISLAADFTSGVSIPVITLDSLSFYGRMLWKIDVEGFEWDVISGAQETVRKHRPDIICEVLPSFAHASEVQSMLQPLGYKFFIALDAGFEERREIIPTREGRDWIFTTGSIE